MIAYTLRHMIRHWRFNLVLLVGLTLAVGLLAGLPSFAEAVAARTLETELESETPAGRNVEVKGEQSLLTGALFAEVDHLLGHLLVMRVEKHSFRMEAAANTVDPVDGGSRLQVQLIKVWSFDRMRDLTRLVEGSYPIYEPPHTQEEIRQAMFSIPVLEAAISPRVSEQTGIKIGDVVYGESGYSFRIVGIIEPIDADSDAWWGDLTGFELGVLKGLNEDTLTLPLIIHSQGLKELMPTHDVVWHVVLDTRQIHPELVQDIEQRMINLKTRMSAAGVQVLTNLPNMLLNYRENLATVQMVLLLLSVQSNLFVYYALFLLAGQGLQRLQGEMAVMAGRGASSGQILLPYVVEGLLLALLAGGLLGPWTAQGLLHGWRLITAQGAAALLPPLAWLLAWAGAGCGWAAICAAAIPAARRSVLEWQQRRARPQQRSGWQSSYLDLILLGIGGAAYWQLSHSGSFVMRQISQVDLADPLRLLGPSLLMLALAMAGMRLFPYVLRGLAWLARGSRGLVLSLGLARLARDPTRPAQITLLISLAAGLAFFTGSYKHSLGLAQADVAHYRAGADLRVRQGGELLETFTALPGVRTASPVFRASAQTYSGRDIDLLGVDPQTFGQVAYYPPGLTMITIDGVLRVVQWEPPASDLDAGTANPYLEAVNQRNPIKGVFSTASVGVSQGIGSQAQISLSPVNLAFTIQGTILNFPTMKGAYMVMDGAAIDHYLDPGLALYYNSREVWLEIDPAEYPNIMENPLVRDALLADAQQELQRIQNNAFTQGVSRAFELNTLTLSVLSVGGLFLIHYFSARQRTYEFGVLRANGLSAGQLWLLLLGEALVVVLIGLLLGTGIGYGLAQAMRTYLNLPLSQVEPGLALYQIQVDWGNVLRQYAWLGFFYLAAVLFSLLVLLRSGVHRVLRLGDE
jgi:putative ABC transport system permease protein